MSGGDRIARALERIARALEGGAPAAEDFDGAICWRWDMQNGGVLRPAPPPKDELSMLRGIDEQTSLLARNTRAFLRGAPSNHALLTGPRGTGKSTAVRGVFARHAGRGLRLIETDAAGLSELPKLLPALAQRREKFILYCDDLAFGEGDARLLRRCKTALDGGVSACENLRVYATSNRRHLVSEDFSGNLARFNEEIHGDETGEEKIALSDRFGLWLAFFNPSPEEYKQIAARWLEFFGVRPAPELLRAAVRWADGRGAFNGRTARYFAAAAANKTEK
ncbi:MAG: DUF815 domain-containing protein [Betaproteobacteria bacterium]|nr:DUF815 domain-containing protein [Betaproteobacteria bacterium]